MFQINNLKKKIDNRAALQQEKFGPFLLSIVQQLPRRVRSITLDNENEQFFLNAASLNPQMTVKSRTQLNVYSLMVLQRFSFLDHLPI